MSKRAKLVVAAVVIVVFVLAGVGGWFVHSSVVKKDYDKAWSGYEDEVKAWADVNERYQVLEPVCGELASEAECGELKTAGEQAGKATEKLSLDLKKAKSASKEEKQKLENETKEIKTEREKFEPAVVKVEKAAEATIQDKFTPVLEEAEKKANEANGLVGSLKGKVKDEKTLKTLESAASELSSACGKWKGKDIPTGQEGVQAYLELKRLTLACNDAVTKANESHTQWQAEQKPKGAYPGAGGPRPANAQPWPVDYDDFGRPDYWSSGVWVGNSYSYGDGYSSEGTVLCAYYSDVLVCDNLWASEHQVYPARETVGPSPSPAAAIYVNGVVDYMNHSEAIAMGFRHLPVGSAWYVDKYVLGRTAEGVTAWDTNSGHGFFISNDGKRTETF